MNGNTIIGRCNGCGQSLGNCMCRNPKTGNLLSYESNKLMELRYNLLTAADEYRKLYESFYPNEAHKTLHVPAIPTPADSDDVIIVAYRHTQQFREHVKKANAAQKDLTDYGS